MNAHAPAHALTSLALDNAPLLRRLKAADFATKGALAADLGRAHTDLNKTLIRMEKEGLVEGDARVTLTAAGLAALEALDRLEGAGLGAEAVWPLDGFAPNPLNPRKIFDQGELEGLAETLVGEQGLLFPLIAYPPNADGIRLLHAGERRWRAFGWLRDQGRLPEHYAAGIPFQEKPADPVMALKIALIENGQRSDLTPWEDAQALRALADATGATGAEVARMVGRAQEGSAKGAKDVQEKIRVAREAGEDAIRAHLDNPGAYTWERLRESVRAAARMQEVIEAPPSIEEDAVARPGEYAPTIHLPPRGALMLAELSIKVDRDYTFLDARVGANVHKDASQDIDWFALDRAGLVERFGSHPDTPDLEVWSVTRDGYVWLRDYDPSDTEALEKARSAFGISDSDQATLTATQSYATPHLNVTAVEADEDDRPADDKALSAEIAALAVDTVTEQSSPLQDEELTAGQRLALQEIGFKSALEAVPMDSGETGWAATNGYSYMSDTFRTLRRRGLIEEGTGTAAGRRVSLVRLTGSGHALVEVPQSGAALTALQAEVERFEQVPGAGEDTGYFTYVLNSKIQDANVAAAWRTRQSPSPQHLLALAEIAARVAAAPAGKAGDWTVIANDARDEILSNLTWAGLVDDTLERQKRQVRLSQAGRGLLKATGATLDQLRAESGISEDLRNALRHSGLSALNWLRVPGTGSAPKGGGAGSPKAAPDRGKRPDNHGEITFTLRIGDFVSIGSGATSYQLLVSRNGNGIGQPTWRVQPWRNGKPYGAETTITLAAIVGIVPGPKGV